MMIWIAYLLLAAVLVAALYITLLNFPGPWIMVGATAVYALVTHFNIVGLKTLIAILVLAAIAELIDFVAGGAGAKKAGGSKRGLIGAMIGGILGGIFLTIPLWIVGTLIGICVGTFLGAIVGELWGGTELARSLRIGAGAAWGRLLGILTKLLFGCVILAVALIAGLPPIPHRARGSIAPSPAPLRTPATTRAA